MWEAGRMIRALFEEGILLGEGCRPGDDMPLLERYRLGETNGFLMLAR
jgi:hypothetical protein